MDWRKTDLDQRTMRSVLIRARLFWRSTFLEAAGPVAWSVDPAADDRIERPIDTRHPAGSARMGLDPRPSVVSPRLACRAVPNVFVASAAVFLSCGTTLTIIEIACRAAESVIAAR
jgi:choline dehydrogenase-like flavoprotein